MMNMVGNEQGGGRSQPGYDVTAALIVTDIQNDFADPAGSLSVAGGAEVVPVANREIAAAVEAGALVVYTQDWHPPSTPHFEKDGGIWPVHCLRGTWGAELHPDLTVVRQGEVVRKGAGGEDGYSAFSERDPRTGAAGPTRLESLLRHRRIERLMVVGLATDYCVKETVLDGRRLGYEAVVLADGVRAVNLRPGDEERALGEMEASGALILRDRPEPGR